MANRSYLYSLSSRPTSFSDRPETISGLSEWPYAVPLSYRILMSGNPQLCASLISDGLDGDSEDDKSEHYAICSDFEAGFARLTKFFKIVRQCVGDSAPELLKGMTESLDFLKAHRNRHLLLETIELDCMDSDEEAALKAAVEREIQTIVEIRQAVDALPSDPVAAATILKNAAENRLDDPLAAFFGLRFDDDFDNTRDGKTEAPLGLYWNHVLYFHLQNQAEFKKARLVEEVLVNPGDPVMPVHRRNYKQPLASLGSRFLGQFIDGVLAIAIGAVLFWLTSLLHLPQAIFILGWLLYLLLCDGLPGGQSVGKRVTRCSVVVVKTGKPCGYGRSTLRNITLMVLGILDIVFILGAPRRRLGDYLAGTKVVEK